MKKTYEIHTTAFGTYVYTVKAKSAKEAEEKFDNGEFDSYNDCNECDVDASEEVSFVREKGDDKKCSTCGAKYNEPTMWCKDCENKKHTKGGGKK